MQLTQAHRWSLETVLIRPATPHDHPHILFLARGERLKPTGLDWPRFFVAEDHGKIVGAVQLRHHPDGSKEIGSLVVAPAFRHRGVAAQLIERRLAGATGRVFVITARVHEGYYQRWGFARIKPGSASPFVCANYWMGYLGGGLLSKLRGRAVNHLAVLERRP
jgi:N-acetylglutamate synthase-like GNAT family acetyltransferase